MVVAQGAAQEQQGLDIKAHEPQRIFCRSAAPTVVFQGGVGSGKTWAGVVWALVKKAMGQPGSAGMMVAATFPMLRQATIPHLQRLAEQTGQARTWQWNRAENVIQLDNGSTIYLRSAAATFSAVRGTNPAALNTPSGAAAAAASPIFAPFDASDTPPSTAAPAPSVAIVAASSM